MGDTIGQATIGADGELNLSITAGDPTSSGITGTGYAVAGDNSVASAVMTVLAKLLGVSPAYGRMCLLYDQNYQYCGFIGMPNSFAFVPGTNLAMLLIKLGASINSLGSIVGPGVSGQISGFEKMPNAALGITVFSVVTEATDLDNPSTGMNITDANGNTYTGGAYYPMHVWSNANGVAGAGHKVPINWAAKRPWTPVGPNNSRGTVVMTGAAETLMFEQQAAYLPPGHIGGPDGIYSAFSTPDGYGRMRIVPANQSGAQGYSVGQYASYASNFVLIAADAQGRAVLLGYQNGVPEVPNITQPNGSPYVIVDYAWCQIFNGSGQIRLWGMPGYSYTGPLPNAANPGYDTTISPTIFGVSDLYPGNTAIMTSAAYQEATNPAGNPGGPEGNGATNEANNC